MGELNEIAVNEAPRSPMLGMIFMMLEGEQSNNFLIGADRTVNLYLAYADEEVVEKRDSENRAELEGF